MKRLLTYHYHWSERDAYEWPCYTSHPTVPYRYDPPRPAWTYTREQEV